MAVSTGAPSIDYRSDGKVGRQIEELLYPLQAMANHTGMVYAPAFVTHSDVVTSDERLAERAEEYQEFLR